MPIFNLYCGVGFDELKLGMSMLESRATMFKILKQKPSVINIKYAIPNILQDFYSDGVDITYNTENRIEMIRVQYLNKVKLLLDGENISEKTKDELKFFLEKKGFKFKRIDGSNVCNEMGFAYSSYRSKNIDFFYIFPKGDFKKILDENKKKYNAYSHPQLLHK